jgi:hypothetical protein
MAEFLVLLRCASQGNGDGLFGGALCGTGRPDVTLAAVHGMESGTRFAHWSNHFYIPHTIGFGGHLGAVIYHRDGIVASGEVG